VALLRADKGASLWKTKASGEILFEAEIPINHSFFSSENSGSIDKNIIS
tara:strand:+ start:280 stop:426 length:147 start_codon:yes stop_codon:yes gene_type:complete